MIGEIIINILGEFTAENGLFADFHHGSRRRCDCSHQLHRVNEKISENMNWRRHTVGVFLDILQAFDGAWHN